MQARPPPVIGARQGAGRQAAGAGEGRSPDLLGGTGPVDEQCIAGKEGHPSTMGPHHVENRRKGAIESSSELRDALRAYGVGMSLALLPLVYLFREWPPWAIRDDLSRARASNWWC